MQFKMLPQKIWPGNLDAPTHPSCKPIINPYSCFDFWVQAASNLNNWDPSKVADHESSDKPDNTKGCSKIVIGSVHQLMYTRY